MGEPIDQPSTTRNNARKLIRDLWNFVENVTDDDPARTDKFFALRERVRNHYASLPRSRSRRSQALASNIDEPNQSGAPVANNGQNPHLHMKPSVVGGV